MILNCPSLENIGVAAWLAVSRSKTLSFVICLRIVRDLILSTTIENGLESSWAIACRCHGVAGDNATQNPKLSYLSSIYLEILSY